VIIVYNSFGKNSIIGISKATILVAINVAEPKKYQNTNFKTSI
jgi:hypothetical protein